MSVLPPVSFSMEATGCSAGEPCASLNTRWPCLPEPMPVTRVNAANGLPQSQVHPRLDHARARGASEPQQAPVCLLLCSPPLTREQPLLDHESGRFHAHGSAPLEAQPEGRLVRHQAGAQGRLQGCAQLRGGSGLHAVGCGMGHRQGSCKGERADRAPTTPPAGSRLHSSGNARSAWHEDPAKLHAAAQPHSRAVLTMHMRLVWSRMQAALLLPMVPRMSCSQRRMRSTPVPKWRLRRSSFSRPREVEGWAGSSQCSLQGSEVRRNRTARREGLSQG